MINPLSSKESFLYWVEIYRDFTKPSLEYSFEVMLEIMEGYHNTPEYLIHTRWFALLWIFEDYPNIPQKER